MLKTMGLLGGLVTSVLQPEKHSGKKGTLGGLDGRRPGKSSPLVNQEQQQGNLKHTSF